MAEAYKVKQDVSLPRAIRELYDDSQNRGGQVFYQTEGRSYSAGDYVLAEDITPPLRKKAEDGDLDHLLEPVDVEEAREVLDGLRRSAHVGSFVAEHAVEAHAMELAGHEVEMPGAGTEQVLSDVPVDQSTEQVTAGAEEVPVEDLTEVRSQTDSPKGEAQAEKSLPKKRVSSSKKAASKE
jgi:hypothetical protein